MIRKIIKASVPGKIHFLGEHTAVYGKPAILAAINKRCSVTLTTTETKLVRITAKNIDRTLTLSFEDIMKVTKQAQEKWETYRLLNDIELLKKIVSDDAVYPIIAIGETLQFFTMIPTQGFELHIDSEIPIGSGHGSSAAVAVSIAGAVSAFLGKNVDKETISKIAIRIEQKKHGNPSYGDVGAVVNGGLIWFQKKTPEEIVIEPLKFSVPESISKNLLVIQSGVPEESTGEMVHSVSEFKKQNAHAFDRILEEQAQLTHDLLEVIKQADEHRLLDIIRAGEKNLETIGVVSEKTKKVIREIEQVGGAAKICGAGGRKNGSGIILSYHQNPNAVADIAKSQKLLYYPIVLGEKGLTVEA